jgi:hypothetical protein
VPGNRSASFHPLAAKVRKPVAAYRSRFFAINLVSHRSNNESRRLSYLGVHYVPAFVDKQIEVFKVAVHSQKPVPLSAVVSATWYNLNPSR